MSDQPLAHRVRILKKEALSPTVDRWVTEKPDGYDFRPGQATHIAIDQKGLRDEDRAFTMTSLPEDDYLEFVIKRYPERDGMTDALSQVAVDEHFFIDAPGGDLTYAGPGTFIAGGAGVTPFIAILRARQAAGDLDQQRLIFANVSADEVFMKDTFDDMLGDRVTYCVDEDPPDWALGERIGKAFLKQHAHGLDTDHFYLCGPPGMAEKIRGDLLAIGVNDSRIVHVDWS